MVCQFYTHLYFGKTVTTKEDNNEIDKKLHHAYAAYTMADRPLVNLHLFY